MEKGDVKGEEVPMPMPTPPSPVTPSKVRVPARVEEALEMKPPWRYERPVVVAPLLMKKSPFTVEEAEKIAAMPEMFPLLSIEKRVVVAVGVEEPISKRFGYIDPSLAWIERSAFGEVELMPTARLVLLIVKATLVLKSVEDAILNDLSVEL